MQREDLMAAVGRLKVETGSLACLGCGYEHSCAIHGCSIIREAVAYIADLEATHRTEMCETGYDCTELGKARKGLEAAEARAEKAEAALAEARKYACSTCMERSCRGEDCFWFSWKDQGAT